MKNPYDTALDLAHNKICLATSNLQKITGAADDEDTMNGLLHSLNQSMLSAQADQPDDLCDAIIVQARLLDALFHRFLDQSKDVTVLDDTMQSALRVQIQMVRSLNTWKELKMKTYMRYKLVKLTERRPTHAERTEQNDDSWIKDYASLDD